jgi:hypothetical protein
MMGEWLASLLRGELLQFLSGTLYEKRPPPFFFLWGFLVFIGDMPLPS